MFCSNRFELICLDICKYWIFVRISLNNCSLVLGGLYLSPSDDARRLFDDLSEFLVSVDSDRLLIMSDLNSRIGEGNRIDEMILSGCSVSASRTSRDKTLNTIGLACLGFLSACGLLVLNGRTVSDTPANFTFVGHNGKSVIDLMLINLTLADFVVDSGILDVGNCSQHFPYFVDLSLFAPSALEHSADCVYKLTWCPELSGIFNVLLEDLMVDSVSTSLEVNSYSCSLSSCITDAAHTLGMIKGRRIGHGRGAASKPWFNEECFRAKRFFRQLRRKCRLSNFEGDSHSRFVEARSAYGNLIRSTKTSYLKNIANQLADSSSPSEFWRIIGSLRSRGSGSANLLSPADVDAHFRNTFNFFIASPPPSSLIHRPTFHDPSLDLDISSDELNLALDCSKIGKAAGRDGITFEFYKSLNDRNRIFLLNLFNGVLHEEKTPDNWSKLKMFLLYKKGDPSLPSNFRGITLMNAITKLFTSILATRIALWADSRGLLPETQNGFRKGRSCIDNIFVLSSCIGERLRNKHGTLLAFFVDFKQAFDRINHDRLWIKLSDMGLSLKIISVLRSFYGDAEVEILINHSASTVVPIKNGVLQGDCLSPLLFSLYLSDFDAFFRMYECPCIDVDSLHSINSIFFADDLVLMASSPIRMKKLISTLAIYCKENLLEVNLSKSKMIVFRRGGKLAQAFNFSYNGSPVEIVSTFTYLGVEFCCSGLFARAANSALTKANFASAQIRTLLNRLSIDSPPSRMALYRSMVQSTLLYAAEIWGLLQGDIVEKNLVQFHKNLYFLPRSTPGYVIRGAFNLVNLITIVFGRALRWCSKITLMEDSRLPKICWLRQLHLIESGSAVFNWALQLRTLFHRSSSQLLWTQLLNGSLSRSDINLVVENLSVCLKLEDDQRISSSSFCLVYREFSLLVRPQLTWDITLNRARLLNQLITLNCRFQNLFSNGVSHRFYPELSCRLCSMGESDTVEHFILNCPIVSYCRPDFITARARDSPRDSNCRLLAAILSFGNTTDAGLLLSFVQTALKMRRFVIDLAGGS